MTLTNQLFTPAPPPEWDAPPTVGVAPTERESYLFRDKRIGIAVNVAMAARRPLLVTGPPGAGKSTLARAVARAQNATYLEQVVTSRTEVSDLTAGFDAVRRLADAQVKDRLQPDWAYLDPGVLWWAFKPESAATRGHDLAADLTDKQRGAWIPVPDPRISDDDAGDDVVLLLDEIDKAEPDLANDLLGPLDRFTFDIAGVEPITAEHDVFIVITSNGERRLPPAFLRRCVQLELRLGRRETTAPDLEVIDFFTDVALARFGKRADNRYREIAEHVDIARRAAIRRGRREPSTAEFIDTVRACLHFDVSPESEEWLTIIETAFWKDPDLPEETVHAAETAPV